MRSVFFGSGADQPVPDFVVPELSPEELRVLGCLIEKQFFTPDVYPLTLNSLTLACNQKTSREPITNYDEQTVDAVIAMLQHKGLATRISGISRVPKYREMFGEKTALKVSEIGVMCALMLRGAQTPGELKERTNRIHVFADNEDVEATLERLINREPQPMVIRLARQIGQKELRYMHLLGGPVGAEAFTSHAAVAPATTAAPREDRISKLEGEVAELRETVANIQRQFAEFRKQFD